MTVTISSRAAMRSPAENPKGILLDDMILRYFDQQPVKFDARPLPCGLRLKHDERQWLSS
jgi:hypothetical protein